MELLGNEGKIVPESEGLSWPAVESKPHGFAGQSFIAYPLQEKAAWLEGGKVST
jgi:hypothetical protein